MAKIDPHVDVLVLGAHPAAYLAAALLRHKSKLRVIHCTIPGENVDDRVVLINPLFFDLHPLLSPLRRKLDGRSIYGLQFVTDDGGAITEHRNKSVMGILAQLRDVRHAMQKLADDGEVICLTPPAIDIRGVDEHGINVCVGNTPLRPKALVLAGPLSPQQHRLLGIPEDWERGVVHRYTFARLKLAKLTDGGARPLMPMSLDLRGLLSWGWLMASPRQAQIAVEQSIESVEQVNHRDLLQQWAEILRKHGFIKSPLDLPPDNIESLDLPLGGALAHEGLANRTLLIGPAGGFYSASAEDVYPNCWSAVFAADVLKKALREPHLQDALQPYRQRWRTTLGDYLRGPQQNLRFLLPLVYRNQIMTTRLTEAILVGRSVIR